MRKSRYLPGIYLIPMMGKLIRTPEIHTNASVDFYQESDIMMVRTLFAGILQIWPATRV